MHHPALHGLPRLYQTKGSAIAANDSSRTEESPFAGNIGRASTAFTLLPIVPVTIEANDRSFRTWALLDQGSEITIIRTDIARKFQVSGPTISIFIETVTGELSRVLMKLPEVVIGSRNGKTKIPLQGAYAMEKLRVEAKTKNADQLLRKWPHLSDLDVTCPNPSEIAVIVGADQPAALEIMEYRRDPLNHRAPRGKLTHFGWTVTGPSSSFGGKRFASYGISVDEFNSESEKLFKDLRSFIGHDMYGTDSPSVKPLSAEERRALQILTETTKLVNRPTSRYEVGVLWKVANPDLPDNFRGALRRFYAQESRLLRNPQSASKCSKAMNESLDLGHVRRLKPEEVKRGTPGRTWYNPYHVVFNPNKPDKCRVVFDLSALFDGISVNAKMLEGPSLISNLVAVMLRFRRHRVGLTADVAKMFHQVLVRPEDASAYRFFWREPGSAEPPSVYEFRVHLFGSTSSPAVCCYALQRAAKDSGPNGERLHEEVLNQFYVDNWATSFKTKEEAVETGQLLIDALRRGGFELTQFASSLSGVLEELGVRANVPNPVDFRAFNLPSSMDVTESFLGFSWNYLRDTLKLKLNREIPTEVKTKRELLKAGASIYDPLVLCVIKLKPKILFQETCRQKVSWDEPLDKRISSTWKEWATPLTELASLEIPRCTEPAGFDYSHIELHVFADASESAFGAIAYARYVGATSAVCRVVMARSNLAPLRPTTMPRMELNATLSAARLSATLVEELQMPLHRVVLWSDATTVLTWINSQTLRFKAYVGSRIGELSELTSADQWRYVPSADNPTDDISRGIASAELHSNHRVFIGPKFLTVSPDAWPVLPRIAVASYDPAEDLEVKPMPCVLSVAVKESRVNLLINKISDVTRIIRTVAFILRWATKHQNRADIQRSIELSVEEITNARITMIRYVQYLAFKTEINCLRAGTSVSKDSTLTKLRPFLNDRGLLCVGGRLENADAPYDTRHPILLPQAHRFTWLIIEQLHKPDGALKDHLSVETTLHQLRRQYWITSGRRTISRVLNQCLRCKLRTPKAITPLMAPLPVQRVKHGLPAFTCTGVDYFGPIEVTILRRRVKRWACLFTCLSSRAVHLELVHSLKADSFINCLTRFEARRGVPKEYFSDNGTNFVGAANELCKCLTRIPGYLSRREVKWHFNPPAAPHFGGVWERLVGTAKRALASVLSGQSLSDEVLETALVQVESLLNSRPLTYLSADPADPEPLTPNHLLLGRANPNLPPALVTEQEICSKKRWRQAQAIATHFWRRWMPEYLATLNARRKWNEDHRNIKPNDVVAVLESANPRGTWHLGRVISVNIGPDKIVRSAVVRMVNKSEAAKGTKTVEHTRPVHSLCLLEPADPESVPVIEHRAGLVPNRNAQLSRSEKD